jgi:hypothetical protein
MRGRIYSEQRYGILKEKLGRSIVGATGISFLRVKDKRMLGRMRAVCAYLS